MIQFCNCLRLYLGIESVSSRLLQLGCIVCYTAVFRVVSNAPPHKRLLRTEPHSFPFVFVV